MASLRILFFCFLIIAASFNSVLGQPQNKRSLDLSGLVRSFLQQSSAVSTYKVNAKKLPTTSTTTTTTTTTTSTTTTTTTPAPKTMKPKIEQIFIKTIPGGGRLGFGFDFNGNFAKSSYPFINTPRHEYINFDYADETEAPAQETTEKSEAATTMEPKSDEMQMTKQPPKPQQTDIQPTPEVVYQYVPVPYFNAPPHPNQHRFNYRNSAIPPIHYDYGPDPLQSYDYTNYYSTQVEQKSILPQQRFALPTEYRNINTAQPVAITSKPFIIAPTAPPPTAAPKALSQLNNNLVYKFAQNDDFYSENGAKISGIDDGAATNANTADEEAVSPSSETSNYNSESEEESQTTKPVNYNPQFVTSRPDIEYANKEKYAYAIVRPNDPSLYGTQYNDEGSKQFSSTQVSSGVSRSAPETASSYSSFHFSNPHAQYGSSLGTNNFNAGHQYQRNPTQLAYYQ